MADLDLDPLLRDLARDAARRARLSEASTLRRSGDQRRLAKGVGVAAGVVLLTTGAFSLMNTGDGAGQIIAAQSEAATGATAPPRTPDRPQWASPTDVVVPPVPTWAPVPPVAPVPDPPRRPGATVPVAPPVGDSTLTATGSTAGSGTGSAPATPSGSSTSSTTSSTTTSPPPPTSPSPSGTLATPPASPAGPTTAPTPTLASYRVTLYDAVAGGRLGEWVGSPGGFGDPSGTLPYTHRVATAAAGAALAPAANPVTVAVGVAANGTGHLTLFSDGKVAADHPVAADWADATALVAWSDPGRRTVTVLALHAAGGLTRTDIGNVSLGATPTAAAPRVVSTGAQALTGASAAAFAGSESDASGALSALWVYVVAGDRLLLVKAPTTGAGAVSELVPSGMAGTVALGRLTADGNGGGVAAWRATGVGSVYYGADAFGRLSYAGAAVALPR